MNFEPTQELMLTPRRAECQRVFNKCLEIANGLPVAMNYACLKSNEGKVYLYAVTMDLHNVAQTLKAISNTIDMPDFIGWVFDLPSWEYFDSFKITEPYNRREARVLDLTDATEMSKYWKHLNTFMGAFKEMSPDDEFEIVNDEQELI
jgi:hypothetical protein